jgi:CubicO group peptidase (beta-lactamase class C family)
MLWASFSGEVVQHPGYSVIIGGMKTIIPTQTLETVIETGLAQVAPAMALAVYHHGTLIHEGVHGYLDPEDRQQPVQPDTRFDFASVTKLFTVTAFLMQVAQQQTGIYVPVAQLIPEFNQFGPRPIEGGQDPHTLERLPAISIFKTKVDPGSVNFLHLLTHTSGLAPWRDLFMQVGPPPPPPGESDPVDREQRLQKALELIAGYAFVEKPGHAVHYSDLGLILLGESVTRLDKADTLADVIRSRITGPLNLDRITFRPDDPANCVPTEDDQRWRSRRCQGEVHDENAASLGGIAGHAGLFGTAPQLARFGQAWLDAVKGRSPDWLLPDLAQKAVTEQADGRGLGWVMKSPQKSSAGTRYSPDSFGHTGFTGTSLWIDPQRELVVALLTNRVYHGRHHKGVLELRMDVHDAVCDWVDTL